MIPATARRARKAAMLPLPLCLRRWSRAAPLVALLFWSVSPQLAATTLDISGTDRVVDFSPETGAYSAWAQNRTTAPVGDLDVSREIRAIFKFPNSKEWQSAVAMAEEVGARLYVTHESGAAVANAVEDSNPET